MPLSHGQAYTVGQKGFENYCILFVYIFGMLWKNITVDTIFKGCIM